MIICEGMDNSGKTTLARRISQRFKIPLVARQGTPPYTQHQLISEVIKSIVLKPIAVFDRYPLISESVYGPILRGVNNLDPEGTEIPLLIESLKRVRPLIIYCRPPACHIKNFKPDSQYEGVEINADRLIDSYDDIMSNLEKQNLMVAKFDYTTLTATHQIEEIVKAYLFIVKEL